MQILRLPELRVEVAGCRSAAGGGGAERRLNCPRCFGAAGRVQRMCRLIVQVEEAPGWLIWLLVKLPDLLDLRQRSRLKQAQIAPDRIVDRVGAEQRLDLLEGTWLCGLHATLQSTAEGAQS